MAAEPICRDRHGIQRTIILWITSVVGLLFVAAAGRCFGEAVGLRAALFYAVSACQLEYAQQVRAYSLFICFAAIVLWAAIKAIQRQRPADWAMLVVSSVGSLWVNYHAAPFLAAVWLGVLILGWRSDHRGQRRKRFLISFVLSAIGSLGLLIPWFNPLWIDLQNPPPIEAINSVDLTGLAYTYITLIQGWCAGPSQLELFEWSKTQAILSIAPWAALGFVLFISLAVSACLGERAENNQEDSLSQPEASARERLTTIRSLSQPEASARERLTTIRGGGEDSLADASGCERTQQMIDFSARKLATAQLQNTTAVSLWMIGLIVAVPLVAAMLAQLASSSFVPRYLASLVIPVSLLFGLGGRLQGWNWRTVCSWGLVAVNVLSFVGRNFVERYDRENYRELVSLLTSQEQSPKLLVLSHYLGNAIEYEGKGSLQLIMVGLNSDEPDDWAEIQARLSQEFAARESTASQRFWIAADWMRSDDLRLPKRDAILATLGARHVQRISGTLDLFLVTATN